MNSDGLSASDVALLSGNNGNNNCGWGGDMLGMLALFFLFSMFGWGGFGGWGGGFGGNGACGAMMGFATQADLQRGFDTQTIVGKLDGITNGICDSTTAVLGAVNGVGTTVMQGFSQAELSRCNQQAALMQQLTTMMFNAQQCCCDVRGDIKDLMYSGAKNTCDIIQSTHNDTDRVIARLDQMEANRQAERIHALELENQKLAFQASQSAQNATIGAMIDASRADILRRTGNDCPVNAVVVQPNTPVTFPQNNCGGWSWGNNCNQCGNC